MTVFDEVIFDEVITLMETFDVVMVHKFFDVLFGFRCCVFLVVTFSRSDYTLTMIGRMPPFLSMSPIEAFPLPLSQISLIHLPDHYDLIILKTTSHRC